MATYKKCTPDVRTAAKEILGRFVTHKPLLDANVNIDLVFAFCDRDEQTGKPLNDAITHQGVKALGLARIMPLKDRVMGRGDAEILIDGDWWTETATEENQNALLDHELHHLAVKLKEGQFVYDSAGRPKLRMRKHDVQFGWFAIIAERHGAHSIEQMQAATLMDSMGQFFWPGIAPTSTPKQVGTGRKKD